MLLDTYLVLLAECVRTKYLMTNIAIKLMRYITFYSGVLYYDILDYNVKLLFIMLTDNKLPILITFQRRNRFCYTVFLFPSFICIWLK